MANIKISSLPNSTLPLTGDELVPIVQNGETVKTTVTSLGGGVGGVTAVTASLPIVSTEGTTPNISIDAASASTDGYLTSTDWSTFNSKQPAGSYLTTVTSDSPLTGSGTSGSHLSIPAATTSVSGYLTSTDWNTFNNKQPAGSYLTTVTVDLPLTGSGTSASHLSIPAASTSTNGYLTSTDWNTFNSKGSGSVTSVGTSGSVNGITLTGGPITGSGAITLGGTLSGVSLTSQVTGTLPVGNGGTGATTLTGYVKGSGTSAFTASSTIPNTDISGLGTMSTQNASSVAITGGSINGTTIGAGTPAAGTFTSATLTTGTISTAPSGANDIVNKAYADSIINGVNYHPACQYATAATLTSTGGAYTYSNGTSGVGATLTGAVNAALVVDGHTMVAGDVTAGTRVLIKNETGAYVNTTTPSAAFNGAYVVTQIATVSLPWVLTRATDYDSSGSGTNEIDQGDFLYVVNGTANANTSWIQQTALPITVGTTQITFVQFGAAGATYTAGTGLTLSGSNQFSITNTGVTANTYGSASAVPVLTTNAQGQLTGVTNTNITIAANAITSGTIAINRGGTAGNATPTAGAVAYGTGTAYAFTTAGTSGQVLTSSGAGAPTWTTPTSGTITGSGSSGAIPKFTSTSAIGISNIYDDGTNVGIGTSSPGMKLDVYGNIRSYISGGTPILYLDNGTVQNSIRNISGSLAFYCATSTEGMRIDSSGNVGIGVTPSAWGSGFTALQNTGGAFWSNSSNIHISQNNYYNGTNYIYTNTGYATRYQLGSGNGSHSWYTAASGTAGNAVSFTQAMTLSGAGGLSVGTTADPGAGAIYATGNITAYYSDDRLKTRKGNIENALDKVLSLDGFHYEANETAQALGYKAKPEVGLSAQQVQAVLPEVVVPAPIDEKYLTVHYERLIPLLVEAMKEQQAQIEALKVLVANKCECCK